jgi:hypothetical protein
VKPVDIYMMVLFQLLLLLILRLLIPDIFIFIYFLLLCWVGVYYGMYKSSYNISNVLYFNSLPWPFSFIPFPHSQFLERFQQVSFFHLQTCVHSICTICTLPHPLSTSSKPSRQNNFK